MKHTFTKRLLSIITALFMLFTFSIPALAENEADQTNTSSIPVTCEAGRATGSDGVTFADEVKAMLPSISTVNVGDVLTVSHPATQNLIAMSQNAWSEYTYQYVEIAVRYVKEGGKVDGQTKYTFTPDQTASVTIQPDDKNAGKTIGSVKITYYWLTKFTDGRPALVTNVINSLTRNVQQNETTLEYVPQYGMDIYNVESKDGLTLTYSADMDMTELGSSFFGDKSWDTLQANKALISDETYVDLHFQFDRNINVSTALDLSGADLSSDMFTEKYDEGSTTWWDIDSENNELILHCRWNSETANSIDDLNPMITLKNVKVTLPSAWGDKDTDEDETTQENTLVIRNHGYVDGKVYVQENGNLKANYCDIDGGEKDDEFVLTISDKVSMPGLEKKIVADGADVDNVSANAGDTVNFKLTSNIPEDLLDVIEYGYSDDVDSPEIAPFSVGNAESYTLTFHDKMDEELVNPTNFVVTLMDAQGNPTVLPSDPTNGFYVLSQPGTEDGCTFEVTLDLGALYNADIIDESDLGTTSVVVTYDATLSGEVTAGTFVNEAWVTTNQDWETSHDEVTVDTYQINIYKYETGNINEGPLSGAEFQLYQKDAEGNVIEDSIQSGFVSGTDGHVTIDGLAAGTYYLKEIKAPEGYVCSEDELEIVIPEDVNDDNIVNVNFANTPVPHTGGTGTVMYTVGGVAIIVLAGILLVVYRKSRKKQDR